MRARQPTEGLGDRLRQCLAATGAATLLACGGPSSSGSPVPDGGGVDSATAGVMIDGATEDVSDAGAGIASDGATGTAPRTCDDLGTLVCGALEACAPFFTTLFFGDESTCVTRVQGDCNYFQTAGQPLDMPSCASALAAPYCHAVLTAGLSAAGIPEVCVLPRGTEAVGAACGPDTQCASLACVGNGEQDQFCGTCASSAGEGEVCGPMSVCEADLVCNVGKCSKPVAPGSSCDPSADLRCPGGTTCLAGACQPYGTAGAPCDIATRPCDHAHGFGCNNSTCAAVNIAAASQACGESVFADCASGLTCSGASPATCVPEHGIGGDCNGDSGTACDVPFRCNTGVCSYVPADLCH